MRAEGVDEGWGAPARSLVTCCSLTRRMLFSTCSSWVSYIFFFLRAMRAAGGRGWVGWAGRLDARPARAPPPRSPASPRLLDASVCSLALASSAAIFFSSRARRLTRSSSVWDGRGAGTGGWARIAPPRRRAAARAPRARRGPSKIDASAGARGGGRRRRRERGPPATRAGAVCAAARAAATATRSLPYHTATPSPRPASEWRPPCASWSWRRRPSRAGPGRRCA